MLTQKTKPIARMIPLHYLKITLLITVFTVVSSSAQPTPHNDPLLALLKSVPQQAVFDQMNALTLSYADYRALEHAAGLPPIADREAFNALDPATRTQWEIALLRLHAGHEPFTNLAGERIAQMPELLGFDYFDVDQTLVYGAAPFVGNLLHSSTGNFQRDAVNAALEARRYERREVATGDAWGMGGDGMTDMANLEMGDPFGGDVGLSSRVVVLDRYTVGNAFIWGIIVEMAETHAGDSPNYGEIPAYPTLINALAHDHDDERLIQTVILNTAAGDQQIADGDPLPRYTLAAVADLQSGSDQLHRVVLLYPDKIDARRAARDLPARIAAFDNGWITTLGFSANTPTLTETDAGYLVSYTLRAPAATPAAVLDGGFDPALIFGFWTTAISQGTFTPLALSR